MTSIYDFIDSLSEKMFRRTMNMDSLNCSPARIGLDERCGRIYIDEECIITDKSNDARLQYYGGFEYVDKEYRQVIGDYVVYLSDAGRVQDCIDRYYEKENEDEE